MIARVPIGRRPASPPPSFLRPAVAGSTALAISIFVGWSLATQRHLTGVTALTLLAIVTIYLSLRPELLFGAWLFAAPFLQESARASGIGSLLVMLFYVFPLVIFVLHMLASNGRKSSLTWYDALPVAYLSFVLASQAVIDASALGSFGFYTGLVHSGVLVGIIAYYFCAFGPLERLRPRHVASVLLSSSSIVAAMAIAEHFTRWNLWGQEFDSTPRRVVATLSNPAVLGAFLGIGIVVATAILVWNGPRELRTLSIATLALTIPALYFTYTRGGMIAAGFVAFVLIAARPRKRAVAIGMAAVVGAVLIGNWNSITGTNVYQQRLTNTQNVQGRLLISKASLRLAEQRPVVGWGYGTFDARKSTVQLSSGSLSEASLYDYTSHNTFLTILVELGVLGLALFVLPWVIVSWQSLRNLHQTGSEERWFTFALLGILGVYVLTAVTIDMRFFSFVPALAWVAVGLLRRIQLTRA